MRFILDSRVLNTCDYITAFQDTVDQVGLLKTAILACFAATRLQTNLASATL